MYIGTKKIIQNTKKFFVILCKIRENILFLKNTKQKILVEMTQKIKILNKL